MTERENFFRVLRHEKPAWTPCFYDTYAPIGCSALNNTGVPGKGGRDMFKVNWLVTPDTDYQPIPDPSEHILEDIHDWRGIIEFPDLEAIDWAETAARDLAGVDRENKVVAYFSLEGNFNRLQSLMGVCEALMAMLTDTDAVYDFFEAHTAFKLKVIDKIAEFYKPDIYVNGDDVCSSTGLLFSPALYRELIKPFEIKLGRAAAARGMLVEHHVCGQCEAIIPDILETGANIWQTAQSMNDLNRIEREYGDRLLIHGGWDSYGASGFEDATEAQVRAEVRRCIDAYAGEGHYMLFPIIFGDPANANFMRRRHWASDECRRYSKKVFAEK